MLTIKSERGDKKYYFSLNNDPESFWVLRKNPKNPHYFLKVLHKKLFGEANEDLSETIERTQQGFLEDYLISVRGPGSEYKELLAWLENPKKYANRDWILQEI